MGPANRRMRTARASAHYAQVKRTGGFRLRPGLMCSSVNEALCRWKKMLSRDNAEPKKTSKRRLSEAHAQTSDILLPCQMSDRDPLTHAR